MRRSSRKLAGLLFALLMVVSVESQAVAGPCTEGNWTDSYTDSWGQTTYSITAPCVVAPDVEFDIVLTVVDNKWTTGLVNVGGAWKLSDNGAQLAFGALIDIFNGVGSHTMKHKLSGSTREHTISYSFRDLGNGGGGMGWDPFTTLSGVTTMYSNLPPIVDAGNNIALASEGQSMTTITGTASDPEGSTLTYQWFEGETALTDPLVMTDGTASLNLGSLDTLSIGEHTFSLVVTDGALATTDTIIITIENSAPVAAPSTAGTYAYGQPIALNGSVADFDGDMLSYTWREGTNVLAAGNMATLMGGEPVALPENITGDMPETMLSLGDHILTLEVSDGVQTVTADTMITVIDSMAPLMSPVSSQSMLWPVNGELTTVTIATNATDNTGGEVTLNAQVTSSQPSPVDKDGNVVPDFTITNIDQATGVVTTELRNSRAGYAGDRLYTVTIKATDQSGNSSKNDVVIKVPHDNGRK